MEDIADINDIFSSYEDVNYDNLITDSILDRDSASYRKAHVINGQERASLNAKEDDILTKALSEAAHLDETLRERYIYLAELYTSDMEDNIFRNQFKLAKVYPEVSADEWNNFLSDRIVSVYLAKHKRTLLKAAAEDNLSNPLAKNKRDNLKLIENLQEQEQKDATKNVVIMRIPNIYD